MDNEKKRRREEDTERKRLTEKNREKERECSAITANEGFVTKAWTSIPFLSEFIKKVHPIVFLLQERRSSYTLIGQGGRRDKKQTGE